MLAILWSRPVSAGSISVAARVDPGPIFVGQAIAVRVVVSGGDDDLTVSAQESDAFEVWPLGPLPPGVEGDEGSATERRFVAIPRRSGVLEIPPFRARSGELAASSRPVRLTVLRLPSVGRTSAFLGGVGPFEIRGEVEPTSVRVGQSLEYRIRMEGPAAWGSSQRPDLSSWEKQVGVRPEPLPDRGPEGDPPSRSFRYRVRVVRGGRLTLPPVAVAAFDPASRRYTTRTTASLAVTVEAPAPFNPASLRYGDDPGSARLGRQPRWGWPERAAIGLVVAAACGLIGRSIARSRARRMRGVRGIIDALSAGLDPLAGEADIARRVTSGLAELLEVASGRPRGVLTPPEAGSAIARLARDDGVGLRAKALIAACDRAIYGGKGGGADALVGEARRLLGEIRVAVPAGNVRWAGGAEGGSRDRIV